MKMPSVMPQCPYCFQEAKLVTGKVIYPHRSDLRAKWFYQCAPCDAYVGCHPNSMNPLGRLANAELRMWKQSAHHVFDKLWKRKLMSRTDAYKMLAQKLGISEKVCHIGMFDVDTCKRVIALARDT